MIEKAIQFILNRAVIPAINSESLDKQFKDKAQNSKRLIEKFRHTGDLYDYLQRFKIDPGGGGQELLDAFKANNLETFEDILPEFEEYIGTHKDDHLRLDDFIIGRTYNSYDLAIISKVYNIMQGGYLIGDFSNYQAVLCKYTLDGGQYPNQWIDYNQSLKVYAKSINNVFKLSYQDNQAITESGDRPIYVFIKDGTDCVFNGYYKYINYTIEDDGSIWFRLDKRNSVKANAIITQEEYDDDLRKRLEASNKNSDKERKQRLAEANKKPEKLTTQVTSYKRNADVIIEVLKRANGICEGCNKAAPFIRAKDNTPYLEVHHKIRLAEDGEDTVENAIAVCPNCHREMHFGKQ